MYVYVWVGLRVIGVDVLDDDSCLLEKTHSVEIQINHAAMIFLLSNAQPTWSVDIAEGFNIHFCV